MEPAFEGLVAHVTAVFVAFPTVAVNCNVAFAPYRVGLAGLMVTTGGGKRLTAAEPIVDPSARLTAVTVTDWTDAMLAGAV